MGLDATGHYVPASTAAPARSAFDKLSRSLRDPFPVADAAARTTLLASLAASSPAVVPSTSSPIFFWRADADRGSEHEFTADGTNFEPVVPTSGLRRVKPSSVAGTGVSVDSSGIITVSAASNIVVNGIFSATYRSYLIRFDLTTSAAAGLRFQLANSGTADGSSKYDRTRLAGVGASASSAQSIGQTNWEFVANLTAARHVSEIVLETPGTASATVGTYRTGTTDNPMTASAGVVDGVIQHRDATAFDGLVLVPTAGTVSGTLRVFGYV